MIYHNVYTDLGAGKETPSTYALFRRVIKYEPYLTNIKIRKHQVMMSKFRLSSNDLEIERGRYGRKPTKRVERYCKLCQTLNISIAEDEFHFLMICPTYESKRKIMPDNIYNSLPNVKVLDAKKQFILLMSQEDVACTQEIAKFITQCMKLREQELDILLIT